MAIAYQTHIAKEGSPDATTTSAIDTTTSPIINLAVVCVSWYSFVNAVTVTDSASNTWTPLTIQNLSASFASQLFYAKNLITSASHTFTTSGVSTYASIFVQLFSGAHATSPFDLQNGTTANPYTTIQPGSITPSEDNCVCVTGIQNAGDGNTNSINGGFTITDQISNSSGSYLGGAIAYLIQTTAAAANPTWTSSVTTYGSCEIADFKSAAAAGGGPIVYGGSLSHGSLARGGRIAA